MLRGLLSLALFEASARVLLSSDRVLEEIAVYDDAWMRLKWVNRHRDGADIYYEFDRFDPRLGWRSAADIRGLEVFRDKTLSTNSHGFRDRREYAYERSPGRKRIVILGNSFTFGDEVSNNETYSFRLQQMLPHVEIYNLGVHGYGHDQMLLLFREHGKRYRPDVVILGFVYIDIFRNILRFNDYAKPRFELRDGELVLENIPVQSPETMLEMELVRPKTLDVLAMLSSRLKDCLGWREESARELTYQILDQLLEEVRSIGAQLLIVYLPIVEEIHDTSAGLLETERYVAEYSASRGIQWATLRLRFREAVLQGLSFQHGPGGHWLAGGHRVVAEGLAELLEQEGYD